MHQMSCVALLIRGGFLLARYKVIAKTSPLTIPSCMGHSCICVFWIVLESSHTLRSFILQKKKKRNSESTSTLHSNLIQYISRDSSWLDKTRSEESRHHSAMTEALLRMLELLMRAWSLEWRFCKDRRSLSRRANPSAPKTFFKT